MMKEPHPLVILLSLIGWATFFAYVIGLVIDWLRHVTWFV